MSRISVQNIGTAVVTATSLLLLPLRGATVTAQLIPIKSVPVASGDQFLMLPSENLALGGTSIALDDRLLDPFVNPAKGSRIEGMTVFGSPTFYVVSEDNGSGRTLPISATYGSPDRWFAGGSFALQELIAADRDRIFRVWWGPQVEPTLREQSATNLYMSGYAGRRLGDSGVSVAASASWAQVGAVDGVEHLYALSQRIDQDGSSVDFRAGVLAESEGGAAFEALIVHNRFDVAHDVTYLDWVWVNPLLPGEWISRIETNRDETRTTGLHLGYSAPVGENGWKVGTIATVNRKSHPKIPNYEIQNIPRDPGRSWAYDLGLGISRSEAGGARYGIDLVFEPIWSDTWAEAAADTVSSGGRVIEEGERTVDNEFFFSNATIRMGLGHALPWGEIGAGLELRSIRYELDQVDHVAESRRSQREDWMEWSPSWGLTLALSGAELRYLGRMTTGTGRPGVSWTPVQRALLDTASSDFLLAPEAPLTLQDAWVLTSQLSVSIPVQ